MKTKSKGLKRKPLSYASWFKTYLLSEEAVPGELLFEILKHLSALESRSKHK